MNYLLYNELEYAIVLIILVYIIIQNIKRRPVITKDIKLDKSTSNSLKGISSILILIAHFYTMFYSFESKEISWFHLSKLCGNFSANAALVIFMFISGYGLSISHTDKESFIHFCKHRLWKVYKPLLIVSILSVIIYILLPNIYSIEQLTHYRITDIVNKSHYFSQFSTDVILFSIGYLDWYVLCISIFYFIYWLTCRFYTSRFKRSFLLLSLMIIYYIISFLLLDKGYAHFYRYPWAFFAGHFIANYRKYTRIEKYQLGIPYILFIIVSFINSDIILIFSWIIAIIILFISFFLSPQYTIEGRNITFLGNISYFIYLSHTRIAFVLIFFIGFNSLLVAILITILISTLLYKITNKKL